MVNLPIRDGEGPEERLNDLRQQYEAYLNALAERFLIALPPWMMEAETADNWQTSAWEITVGGPDSIGEVK